jgi:hypothetical protein
VKKTIIGALALASVLISNTAIAACWTPKAAEAAEVRDLDTMLMVASLRCRSSTRNFITEYNSFVKRSRPVLAAANETLRLQFASAGGLNAYDRYVTSLANTHGGGTASMDCRDMMRLLDDAQDRGGSVADLARLARTVAGSPKLPGGRCSVTVAQAR